MVGGGPYAGFAAGLHALLAEMNDARNALVASGAGAFRADAIALLETNGGAVCTPL